MLGSCYNSLSLPTKAEPTNMSRALAGTATFLSLKKKKQANKTGNWSLRGH